jgi:superfamily II DNA helicase RecQ
MFFRIMTIPFDAESGTFLYKEVERFMSDKKVISIRPSCFKTAGKIFWSAFIVYDKRLPDASRMKEENSYAELTDPQKALLAAMKQWRNEKAAAEGFPPYLVATNRQLIEIVQKAPRTMEGLTGMVDESGRMLGGWMKECAG